MNEFGLGLFLVSLFALMSISCGSIVKDRSPFSVKSSQDSASIYLDSQKLPVSGKAIPSDYKGSIQAKSECKGYKTEYDVLLKNRNSMIYLLNFVLASFFLDKNPEEYDEYYMIQHRHEEILRVANQKFINVNSVTMNIGEEDFQVDACSHAYFQYAEKKGLSKRLVSRSIRLDKFYKVPHIDTSIYSAVIVSELFDLGYIDTVNFSFSASSDIVNLNADINEVTLQIVKVNMVEYFVIASTEISWEFTDMRGTQMFRKKTNSDSGKFLFTTLDMSATLVDYVKLSHVSNRDINDAIQKAILDAVRANLYDFLRNRSVKEALRS